MPNQRTNTHKTRPTRPVIVLKLLPEIPTIVFPKSHMAPAFLILFQSNLEEENLLTMSLHRPRLSTLPLPVHQRGAQALGVLPMNARPCMALSSTEGRACITGCKVVFHVMKE